MNESKIRITQYEQAADEKVSLGGIKWERKWDVCIQCDSREEAERVRAALTAQPEQEPVAWVKFKDGEITHAEMSDGSGVDMDLTDWTPLYTTPPRREWVGLTATEQMQVAIVCGYADVAWIDFACAIEAKLKEKNA